METFNDSLQLGTDFWQVTYRPYLNILHVKWKKNASEMGKDVFKNYLYDFIAMIKQRKAKGFLVDSLDGHFMMDLEIQEWHDQEIAPLYVANNIKKIAFVLPKEDFFAAISIGQSFEEKNASILETKFFEDIEEALSWFE